MRTVFPFLNIEESENNNYTYLLSSFNKGLKIEQKNGNLIFHDTTLDEYNNIWKGCTIKPGIKY